MSVVYKCINAVERSKCTIEDWTRCQTQYLLYARFPMIIGSVIFATNTLDNKVVGMITLSDKFSPISLTPFFNLTQSIEIISLTFEEYVEFHVTTNVINNNNEYTTSSTIVLCPS